MAKNVTLDPIDRQILEALQEDGSLSVADLAERLNMTSPPCWRRVRRLKDEGILQKQIWLVNPEAVGLELMLYATVKLAAHDAARTEAFREQVQQYPEILECYILLGNVDVLLKVVVPDIKYYETFFYEKLARIPGVREVNSSVILTEVKNTKSVPVGKA